MSEVVGKESRTMLKQKNVTTGKHIQIYVIILGRMTHWKKV